MPHPAPPAAPDLTGSHLVRAPERPEPGYWAGCPSVRYEPDRDRFLLTYRERRPRGTAGGPDRGWRCAVAESTDGIEFHDLWSVRSDELRTPSMERLALLRRDGEYLLHLSYVDPADNRWRIDALRARRPEDFDLATRTPVLTAENTGTEGVKDPYLLDTGDTVHLFSTVSRARPLTPAERDRAHATADIHTTGLTVQPTARAQSPDGRHFTTAPGRAAETLDVGPPGAWDAYESRITAIVPHPRAGWLALYDGSADATGNYEERCGLATSPDLHHWHRLTPDTPWLPTARYADLVAARGHWYLYYEHTRPDGAHELRTAILDTIADLPPTP
ncbi:hypothetical protein KSE_18500 [Kitasatospora setae KM-6054]|uniref:Glycosidase n=2 Tax=Streptomycetaceae TaxID=2062 RepID=E4N8Z4_KITSK|nr:hypothetical protein [Kitasatospora sp. SID7827]BAJ27675.1 hypothetical protein KSE_18500 [Kitasatospora setae KM-6054]